jgi:hypothetical protein
MMIETILSGVIGGSVGAFSPLRASGQVQGIPGPSRSADSRLNIEDHVELSPAAQRTPSSAAEADSAGGAGCPSSVGGRALTPEQKAQTEQLKRRDAEVRQHEAAHSAAAGAYARGGARFEYQTGPDGHAYAVGGEVDIDTSPAPNDPAATIAKMETVRAAALAPADPSGQDRRVAAEATAAIQQAEAEKSKVGAPGGAAGKSPGIPSTLQAKAGRSTPEIESQDQGRRTSVPAGRVDSPAAVARAIAYPLEAAVSGSPPITSSYAASSSQDTAVHLLDLVA